MTITVWEAPGCMQCNATKREFNKEGAFYDRKDLSASEHAATLDAFRQQLGGSPDAQLLMPVVTTDTETWQGYRPDKIQAAAQQQASQYQPMIQPPSVSSPGIG